MTPSKLPRESRFETGRLTTLVGLLGGAGAPLPPGPFTLIQICRSYAQSLEDEGKASAQDVKRTFERFIAPSELAFLPAGEIKSTAFTSFLRDVIRTHSGHTAFKVRACLHAAYARALHAQLDPSGPESPIDYGIEWNPISAIHPMSQYKLARHRVRLLHDSELREIWRRLQPEMDLTIAMRAVRLGPSCAARN